MATQSTSGDNNNKQRKNKVVNDPVHGHIELHPLCIAIIDTPQFQRLRYLKQLGTCDFVYPAAVHTRFEHSIGVYHLAGMLIKSLQERQEELNITEKDVLCVQIAGLCHDLGHGPFSHMFDSVFIPSVTNTREWKHEKGSVAMFKHMYNDHFNNLASKFEAFGLNETDRIFIEEQIGGVLGEENGTWPYKGRGQEQAFLYDIVANKRNGIDVDKWDYISRDCLHLGMKSNFDHLRFIHFARVIRVGKVTQISLRDKEAYGIYQMYQTRYFVHKMACQHRVTSSIGLMIAEAMKEANNVIRMPKAEGMVKMSDCIKDENMDAYMNLTDEIIRQILLNPDPRLEKARQLVRDVWRRKLYICVVESTPIQGRRFAQEQKDEILSDILRFLEPGFLQNQKERFVVELVDFSFGTKNHPIENMYFYSKLSPDVGKHISPDKITHWVPKNCEEQIVRVFLKPSESDAQGDKEKCEKLGTAFRAWFRETIPEEPSTQKVDCSSQTDFTDLDLTAADSSKMYHPD
ncbi:deoxynucleoside triphosphate triphosphohydrolase SAMHD1-like [Pomacea canaliculata]|nr:deoxynucleoside triphosphate triphosphohydrolase SAMHD1-like [Pomacea canaliculata]XP_025116188.1 deoxynucleoside triphosphate triphosphohydrolase SAMHD1-like [Pomacea canaliculata]XP_025116189.1 deoxynucleoside triphosphate triphosphohydrolase SAMHD1-like [Pomacea canaliculata]XP_025116190.1 deoxynucleoside triphosphate triphosphohydrolase SAMHD1-like [Pomacea canaliculata]